MKHIFLFRLLVITCLLLTNCSPKASFYFSESTGGFGPYQKVQPKTDLPDNLVTSKEVTELKQANPSSSPVFTATAAIAINLEQLPLPEKNYSGGFRAGMPAKVVKTPLHQPIVKIKAKQKKAFKQYLEDPVANKKVQGAALAGLLLSFVALGLFFAGAWPLAGLFGIVSSVLGMVGLGAINKNRSKYGGRALAWIPIILGAAVAIFIVAFIVSFAG